MKEVFPSMSDGSSSFNARDMYLVMRLNGQELERELLLPNNNVQQTVADFQKKYKDSLAEATTKLEFYIEGIPSNINRFKSLTNEK